MIVGPERSYWILHHDHWNEEALRTFLLRRKRELVSVWQRLPLGSELHMGKERCCLRGLDHLHGERANNLAILFSTSDKRSGYIYIGFRCRSLRIKSEKASVVFMCLFMSSSLIPTYNFVRVRTRLLCTRSQILFQNFAWWHMCRLYSIIMELGTPNPNQYLSFYDTLSNNMFVYPFYVLCFLFVL